MNLPVFLAQLSAQELVQWDALLESGMSEEEAQVALRPDYLEEEIRAAIVGARYDENNSNSPLNFAPDRGAYPLPTQVRQALLAAESVPPRQFATRWVDSFGAFRTVCTHAPYELHFYSQARPLSELVWQKRCALAFLCGGVCDWTA
jgi:hypothetical protein